LNAAASSTNGSAFIPTAGFNVVPELGTEGFLLSPVATVPKIFYRLRAESTAVD
jgi:hypothetical protein